MSSPITTEYTLTDVVVIAATLVTNAVRAAKGEYDDAIKAAQAQEEARRERQAALRAAVAARLGEFKAQSETLNRRIARLAALEGETPELPATPQGSDIAAWSSYLLTLEGISNALDARVTKNADAAVRAALATLEPDSPDAAEPLENILNLYLARRRAKLDAEGKARNEAEWRRTVARILARLELPTGEPVPERLEALARAVILAETPERAELLGNELRLQTRRYQQEEAARKKDRADAERWLTLFAGADWAALPAPLTDRLAAVAAGLVPLDASERQELEAREAAFITEKQALENRAAAQVLAASLEDLGYQVEGIDETLLVEGGIAHFQRPGWDDYYVRLRVNVARKTFNFNVVRAENPARESSTAQRREDFMADERWCAEFPRVMATLAARGLGLTVTRRIEAGELPVQVVSRDRLPDFSPAEAKNQHRKQPALKHLPL